MEGGGDVLQVEDTVPYSIQEGPDMVIWTRSQEAYRKPRLPNAIDIKSGKAGFCMASAKCFVHLAISCWALAPAPLLFVPTCSGTAAEELVGFTVLCRVTIDKSGVLVLGSFVEACWSRRIRILFQEDLFAWAGRVSWVCIPAPPVWCLPSFGVVFLHFVRLLPLSMCRFISFMHTRARWPWEPHLPHRLPCAMQGARRRL